MVIQQLPNPLRDAICVFYLVLRGLDTVEDDMALSNDIKLPALLSFHEDIYHRSAQRHQRTLGCMHCMHALQGRRHDSLSDASSGVDTHTQLKQMS